MTSPKKLETMTLSKEVAEKTQAGIYKVDLPKLVDYEFRMSENEYVPSIQFKCQSLFAKHATDDHPAEMCCCNSTVKTIIGKGSGDQTELIECGKCRTSYLIRSHYNDDGTLEIKTSVWDIGRNAKRYCTTKRDKDYNYWVQFDSNVEK